MVPLQLLNEHAIEAFNANEYEVAYASLQLGLRSALELAKESDEVKVPAFRCSVKTVPISSKLPLKQGLYEQIEVFTHFFSIPEACTSIEIMAAVLCYNMGLMWQSRVHKGHLERAILYYDCALDLLRPLALMSSDDNSRFIMAAALNNLSHIFSVLFEPEKVELCLNFVRQLVRGKYRKHFAFFHECLTLCQQGCISCAPVA